MSIRSRVSNVVKAWSQTTGFASSDSLSTIWGRGPQASSIPFPTPALLTLITLLQHEFAGTGDDSRDLSGLGPGRFAPSGTINSVDDLVSAVDFSPTGVVQENFLLSAHPQSHIHLVNAVADEVERRLRPKTKKSVKKAAKKPAKGDK